MFTEHLLLTPYSYVHHIYFYHHFNAQYIVKVIKNNTFYSKYPDTDTLVRIFIYLVKKKSNKYIALFNLLALPLPQLEAGFK